MPSPQLVFILVATVDGWSTGNFKNFCEKRNGFLKNCTPRVEFELEEKCILEENYWIYYVIYTDKLRFCEAFYIFKGESFGNVLQAAEALGTGVQDVFPAFGLTLYREILYNSC